MLHCHLSARQSLQAYTQAYQSATTAVKVSFGKAVEQSACENSSLRIHKDPKRLLEKERWRRKVENTTMDKNSNKIKTLTRKGNCDTHVQFAYAIGRITTIYREQYARCVRMASV